MTANRPEGHTPQVPAWTAVDLPERTVFSMLFARGAADDGAVAALLDVVRAGDHTPDHAERARVVNAAEPTAVLIGYWTDPNRHERWRDRPDVAAALALPGVLTETATIPADRWETLHSTDHVTPGVRNLLPAALTDVHEYWGAARDRIAASATSELSAEPGEPVPGNLCLIRSGQIWEYCDDRERDIYFGEVEPNLIAGIDFLDSHPETGCLSARFLREQTLDGTDLESTSFVGWFDELRSLEDWAKSHPTHLAIFNSFLAMVAKLEGRIGLRLWHEVAAIPTGGVTTSGSNPGPLPAG
jgi:phenylacetaldoxime dehydratase/aldoxime dehydratase